MKLSEWIPVFRTGTHTDGAGQTHTYGPSELDRIIAQFNPAEHEPPVVIGHPQTDSPAFGWVAGLKREGELLLAQFKDLVPEFVDMVQKGLFKKRSIALYPDLTLRHVGYLGAAPPAVKGLPDVAFREGAFAEVEVEPAHTQEEETMEKGQFTQWLKDGLVELGLVKGPEDKKAAEFAEQAKALTAREEALKAKEAAVATATAAAAAKTRAAEIATFCDGLKTTGHLLPAWEKLGLRTFLASLPHEQTLTFAEGGQAMTPLAFMQQFLSELPKTITFGEAAGADKKKPDETTDAKAWAAAEFAKNHEIHVQLGTTVEMLERIAPVRK